MDFPNDQCSMLHAAYLAWVLHPFLPDTFKSQGSRFIWLPLCQTFFGTLLSPALISTIIRCFSTHTTRFTQISLPFFVMRFEVLHLSWNSERKKCTVTQQHVPHVIVLSEDPSNVASAQKFTSHFAPSSIAHLALQHNNTSLFARHIFTQIFFHFCALLHALVASSTSNDSPRIDEFASLHHCSLSSECWHTQQCLVACSPSFFAVHNSS